jgi:hypothetical protein
MITQAMSAPAKVIALEEPFSGCVNRKLHPMTYFDGPVRGEDEAALPGL